MPRYWCPHCMNILTVSDEVRARCRAVRCGACRAEIRLPKGEPTAALPAPPRRGPNGTVLREAATLPKVVVPPPPPPPPLSVAARPRVNRRPWLIAGALSAAVALAALCAIPAVMHDSVPAESREGAAVLPEEKLVEKFLDECWQRKVEPLYWGPHDLDGLLWGEVEQTVKSGRKDLPSRLTMWLQKGDKLVRARYRLGSKGEGQDAVCLIRDGVVLRRLSDSPLESPYGFPEYVTAHELRDADGWRSERGADDTDHCRNWLRREVKAVRAVRR